MSPTWPVVSSSSGSPSSSSSVDDVIEEAGARFEAIGRAGWFAKGVVYLLLGVLFVRIAVVDAPEATGEEANQAGVLETIAGTTFGGVLLTVLVVGLALYAAWRFMTVIMPGDWTGRALLDRGGYLVSTIVYSVLCFTAVELLAGDPTPAEDPDRREDRLVEDLVADVLSVTLGRVVVSLAGLAFVVVGMVFVRKGLHRSFRSELDHVEGLEGSTLDRLGTVGWIARGASMGLIGVFLVRAAWLHDSEHAAGLDDSIRQLTGSGWGTALAALVGLGFVAYAVFVLLSARHRILRGPTNDH